MNRKHFPLTGLFIIPNQNMLQMGNNTEVMEIILFGDEPVKNSTQPTEDNNKNITNLQVIELSDQSSEKAIFQQLKLDSSASGANVIDYGNRQTINSRNLQENMAIFAKLPPDTILIRQDNEINCHQEVEDQRKLLKEMAETTISGKTTSGAPPVENPRRIQRGIRNKKTVEVRRNPIRVSKKNLDKNFVNPRQRLLSTKRKENSTNSESISKRVKLSSTPYMNTRSVTRKLYTVGSTYQPPTIYDAMEWKEWPVHGMHERPVFHPRFGLGVEYINQFFKSKDGVQDESNAEVTSVDPREEIAGCLDMKKSSKRKIRKLRLQPSEKSSEKDDKSFENIMHTSLHSVFAYCAQVSSPMYHRTIQRKLFNLETESCNEVNSSELLKSLNLKNESKSENEVLSFKKSQSTKCLITPRSSSYSTTNLQVSHSKLHNVIRGSSKNDLILFKAQEPAREFSNQEENPKSLVLSNDQFFKPSTNELSFELTKLDDSAISDETLMEMSSIYEKFVPVEDLNSNSENLTNAWEDQGTDCDFKICEKENEVKDNNRKEKKTSEIAKILSEYIQSINKVPETQNCVLQSEVKNSRNDVGFNERNEGENSKMEENNILRKSATFIKEHIIKIEDQNEMEMEKILDLSTQKSKEENVNKENEESEDLSLQNLLENTAILYCAATGVHQSHLADYINTLDAKQSLKWLKDHNS